MDRESLSAKPDKDLISLIQQDPEHTSLPFRVLYDRWWSRTEQYLLGTMRLDYDDAQDVLSDFWWKVHRKLPDSKCFQYEGDRKFRGWLFEVLKNTALDYLKKKKRLEDRLPIVSIHQEILLKDGSTIEFGETISSEIKEDTIDREQRERAAEIVEQCLPNGKAREVAKLMIMGQPLPPGLYKNKNVYWHRAMEALKRLNIV